MVKVQDIAKWFLSQDSMTHKKSKNFAITHKRGTALYMMGPLCLKTRSKLGFTVLLFRPYILFMQITSGILFLKEILMNPCFRKKCWMYCTQYTRLTASLQAISLKL